MIVEELMMNFLEISFYYFKRILIWQKILGDFCRLYLNIFLNIIGNVNFFSDLKIEYYCGYYSEILLQVSFKKETKIDWRGHKIFSEKITGL